MGMIPVNDHNVYSDLYISDETYIDDMQSHAMLA
jgi:hypothetical protein